MEQRPQSFEETEEVEAIESKGLREQPCVVIFFDNPPRGGDPEAVTSAEIRFSTKTTHSKCELTPLHPNPYAPMPAFYHVCFVEYQKEYLWVVELNNYRIAKCGSTTLPSFSVDQLVANMKTLQVAEDVKLKVKAWWAAYFKNGSTKEDSEVKELMNAIDAKISWLQAEAKKKEKHVVPKANNCASEIIMKETPRAVSSPGLEM